ncbi:uncharacterized protein BYT42DRAFT_560542 [Radiomyces spectabilis]|uniref:uncharacterized protein n=1 Tax=Radiomyces spectabilis TaxID=64574 RepID=UPI0022201A7E|nr:uncharacterized protein BYT42DRAFT_560542 [Radiomyces spectabilis]KAI8388570.1 hypothetical protein BYT42DRAFT_560542 [Radiomyces spectabilis]
MVPSNKLPPCLRESKCIIHVDLDCFYAQVEHVRLGIPLDQPLAVQQWWSVIAVNYAARAKGVAKQMPSPEAKKLCPDIQLVHTATYTENDTEPQYHVDPNRSTHKVSLEPYRAASKKIMKIFGRYCTIIQRIGLDEAFMDVTSIVNQRIIDCYIDKDPDLLEKIDDDECDIPIDWDTLGVTIPSEEEEAQAKNGEQDGSQRPWAPTTWCDLQLAIGAEIAAEIRKTVFDELHYTCSAGISHYKVVAKLCSSRNKPNKQTILRKNALVSYMKDVPFNKIRNLGGKLGTEVGEELNIQKASDLWPYALKELQDRFGKSTGLWLYNISRGIDNEEVQITTSPKSLMAAKAMHPPLKSGREMERWFKILSTELYARIMINFEEYGTWPKSIVVHYHHAAQPDWRTKSLPMLPKSCIKSPHRLAELVINATNKLTMYPCRGLSLQASGLSLNEAATTNQNISRYFVAEPAKKPSLSPPKNDLSAEDTVDMLAGSLSDDAPFTEDDEMLLKKVEENHASRTKSEPARIMSQDMGQNQSPTQEQAWTCDKCFKRLQHHEIEEHTDYHFAMELQEQERGPAVAENSRKRELTLHDQPPSLSPSSSSSSSSKRSNHAKDARDNKKRQVHLFFQPRP